MMIWDDKTKQWLKEETPPMNIHSLTSMVKISKIYRYLSTYGYADHEEISMYL